MSRLTKQGETTLNVRRVNRKELREVHKLLFDKELSATDLVRKLVSKVAAGDTKLLDEILR